MRSRTPTDLAGRCPTCWLQTAWCLCDRIIEVSTSVEVVIVRHPVESWRTSGTGRIAGLALEKCRILELSEDVQATDAELAELRDAWLLYPGAGPEPEQFPSGSSRPSRLVVLDGTWRQARRMLRRLPSLWQLPRLSLPDKADPPARLRAARLAHQRSTLESIADAMAVLDGEATALELHRILSVFVERSLAVRGRRTGGRDLRSMTDNAGENRARVVLGRTPGTPRG